MPQFRDLFQRLVEDLGGPKAATTKLGCSRSSINRLIAGQRRVHVDSLSAWMRRVEGLPEFQSGQGPLSKWDKEALEGIIFNYWMECAPESVQAKWRDFATAVGLGHSDAIRADLAAARLRITELEQRLEIATLTAEGRLQSMADRVSRALRRMHAERLAEVEAARAAAQTLAFSIEVHGTVCPDTGGLPSVEHLHHLLRSLGIEPRPVPPSPAVGIDPGHEGPPQP